MIAVKYMKVDSARYISHIDVLRHITRTIRRANIDTAFSQGFNPHMMLKLSAPGLLGLGSTAEYFTADSKGISSEEFLSLYNKYCPKGIMGIKAWDVKENPNFQGIANSADYFLPSLKVQDKKILEILEMKQYFVSFSAKGAEETKDVRALINNISINEKGLFMRLAYGNNSLRADRFIKSLNDNYHIDAELIDLFKTAQYTEIKGKTVSFDDFLDRL